MPFKLHEFNETKFDGGCLAYLSEAYNVAVTENLQQPHTLSFEYPMDNEKWKMITEHRIVTVEGQAYRLTDVSRQYNKSRILKANAERIFFADARRHHLPTIGNDTDTTKTVGMPPYTANSTIGVDPYVVISEAVKGTKFKLIPESELKEKGMTRIGADGVKIDFFPTDKINAYDVITSVIDTIGYGEIYIDNYRFAVVERIGVDNGMRLSLTKNLTSLTVKRATNELTTRLYPYGADDLTISSVNGGVPYIQSDEAAKKYGIMEGYMDYSDYTDPEKIKAHATWDLMGEGNDYRLDTPQLTITGDVVDLSKLAEYGDFEKIALGDTVHVYEDETVHHKRIINITYYPYSAKQPNVTIGVPSNTNRFYAAWYKGKLFKVIQKNHGKDNKFKTTYFTGTLNSTQNPVQSANKQLLLDGDLLYIEDDKGRRRVNLGNMDGVFVFEMFNQLKKKTISMDEDGNVTITGIFSTGTDDEARTVIDKNGIQSYDADGNRYGLWCNEPSSNDKRYADLKLYYNGQEAFQVYNGISETSIKLQGNTILYGGNGATHGTGTWKFQQGASGTFQTADGKTVTVSGGLITDIS